MTRYLDIAEVYYIHEKMIEVGGGRPGVRDFTLVQSAIERPKATFGGKDLYPTLWLKAGALLQSLVKNHPFEDGNKRTGFFTTLRFLNINGKEISATKNEIVSFALDVDTKNLSIEEIADWYKIHSK